MRCYIRMVYRTCCKIKLASHLSWPVSDAKPIIIVPASRAHEISGCTLVPIPDAHFITFDGVCTYSSCVPSTFNHPAEHPRELYALRWFTALPHHEPSSSPWVSLTHLTASLLIHHLPAPTSETTFLEPLCLPRRYPPPSSPPSKTCTAAKPRAAPLHSAVWRVLSSALSIDATLSFWRRVLATAGDTGR